MRIQRSGSEHFSMYIDGAEVSARGWSELDEAHVRDLADSALCELGLQSEPHVIESYAASDGGALIFVSLRDRTAQEVYFAFADADALLDALPVCAVDVSGARCFHYEDLYILALNPGSPAGCLRRLSEFGVRLRAGALMGSVLAEHGVV